MRRSRCLMVAYGGGHAAALAPVARMLEDTGVAEPEVIGLTIGGAAFRRLGVESRGFRHFIRPSDERAIELGRQLTKGDAPHPDVPRAESVAYHGLSFQDLIERKGEAAAYEAWHRDGRAAFLPVSILDRIISETEPDVVLATCSPRAERAAIMAASARGIPACSFLDMFGLRQEWLWDPGFGDRVAVVFESMRDHGIRMGRPAEDLVVTGNPAFDGLAAVRDRRLQRRSSGPGDGPNVLWATSPMPLVHPRDASVSGTPTLARDIAASLTTGQASHGWNVEIRPHPGVPTEELQGIGDLRLVSDIGLDEHLAWADVVVVTASTVGLQAALIGIPVVAVDGSVFNRDVPLADHGFAARASTDDLPRVIEEALADPGSSDIDPGAVGGATRRMVELVESLIDT